MLSQEQKQLIQTSYRKFTARDNFRPRYGQRLMIAEIAKYLGSIKTNAEGLRSSEPATCVVEAGTGTGKTLGYCIATLPLAIEQGKKLVLSTATTALQDQVLSKDLPELAKHSGIEFSYALAKGRGRYVCLSKLEQRIEAFSADPNDATMPLFLLDQDDDDPLTEDLLQGFLTQYASGDWDGDRDSLEDIIDHRSWSLLTADNQQCSNRRCSYFNSCPYYEARNKWDDADVLIANHDLVLSDLALGGGVILPSPEHTVYVFDEAHHLSEKALGHFLVSTGLKASESWLKNLTKALSEMLPAVTQGHFVAKNIENISPLTIALQEKLKLYYENLGEGLDWESEDSRPSGGTRTDNKIRESRYRFKDGLIGDELRDQAHHIKLDFASLCRYLEDIRAEINRSVDEKSDCGLDKEEAEQWFPVIGTHFNRADSHYALWQFYAKEVKEGDAPDARWVTLREYDQGSDIFLFGSPLSAGGLLNAALWKRAYGAVLTSATLTALGKFDHFKYKTGLPESSVYQQVPSPFDFANAGELRVPNMKSAPNQAEAHTDEIIENLEEWVGEHKAVLVLFSSRKQMNDVFFGVDRFFRERIMTQDDMGKQELIERHKQKIDSGEESILFGLASLAEGIDLPGDYLTHVIIAKIPFAVPNDPLEQSIAEWIEAQGRNPFMEVTVPDASLKLIQACGRLIRSETDKGVITILDQRLLTKRYGGLLLNSLPPYTKRLGT